MLDWDWGQLVGINFKWREGWKTVLITWCLYWSAIYFGQIFMANRKALELKNVTAAHNMILCLWSLAMFVGIAYEQFGRRFDSGDLSTVYCAKAAPDASSAFYWLYIYYLSKYYELFDTIIRVLKKKPVIFLHWYHHSVVILMTYTWVSQRILFSGAGMLANTLVHVFMYYYYYASTLGHRVWYKRYITVMQLVQFAASFVLFLGYIPFSLNGKCKPEERPAVAFSMLCNVSFMVLFSQFYSKTYTKPSKTINQAPATLDSSTKKSS